MGCVLCNITRCKEFDGDDGKKVANPFYCKTDKEENGLLNELAYDIAANHPKIMRRINRYFKKLREDGNPHLRVSGCPIRNAVTPEQGGAAPAKIREDKCVEKQVER